MMSRPTQNRGCWACRKMKKKCDGARPACTRCRKAGRKCPGYPSEEGLVFRSMNKSAMARSNKPTTLLTIQNASETFYIQPSTDWAQYAISRFVYNFVEPPTSGGIPGYLEFLPTMLNSADAGLQTSLLAASLASLANTSGMQHLMNESRLQYGRALKSVCVSLSGKSTAIEDHVLLAVLMLQKYDTITGSIDLKHDPHQKVMTELIRLRHLSGEAPSSRSISLSRIVVIRTEIQAMDNRPEDSYESELAVCRKYSAATPFRLLLRDTAIAWRRLDGLTTTKDISKSQLGVVEEAWKFAAEVFDRMLLWPSTVPTAWQMRVSVQSNLLTREIGHKNTHVLLFTSVQYGAIWIAYFCSRIHLCLSLLKTIRSIQEKNQALPCKAELKPSASELEGTITSTVGSILSSSAFLLGDVDSRGQEIRNLERRALGAFFLLRGLDVALTVPTLCPTHQKAILNILKRIGSEFGIKAALNRREEWLAQNPNMSCEALD